MPPQWNDLHRRKIEDVSVHMESDGSKDNAAAAGADVIDNVVVKEAEVKLETKLELEEYSSEQPGKTIP